MSENKYHGEEALYENDNWDVIYYGNKNEDERLEEFDHKDYGYVILARRKDGEAISVGLTKNPPFERGSEIIVSGPRIKRFYYSREEIFDRLNDLLEEFETV